MGFTSLTQFVLPFLVSRYFLMVWGWKYNEDEQFICSFLTLFHLPRSTEPFFFAISFLSKSWLQSCTLHMANPPCGTSEAVPEVQGRRVWGEDPAPSARAGGRDLGLGLSQGSRRSWKEGWTWPDLNEHSMKDNHTVVQPSPLSYFRTFSSS